MTDMVTIPRALFQDLIDDVCDYAASREFKSREKAWRDDVLARSRALLTLTQQPSDTLRIDDHEWLNGKCIKCGVTAETTSLKNPMVRFPTEEDIREWEEAKAERLDADGWLQSGGLLYRLTGEPRPQNRDEINVTMANGSRDDAPRAARASQILALIAKAQQPSGEVALFVDNDESDEFIRACQDFDDDGETCVDYGLLMKWASDGLLDCDHFTITKKGRAAIDAARAQGGES
ncbi:hypothetical protein [Burkholderia stagnalis]|uniref:hypothetical protein n=1 Tax=Burkholderia stagnalis TaxID=1503054 RepID=UPI00075F9F07|nr:hypothetical protein [Burkholderia stagnalis]KWN77096.1 hypothetical protein WT90_06960 [Burkholderia stagnalis]